MTLKLLHLLIQQSANNPEFIETDYQLFYRASLYIVVILTLYLIEVISLLTLMKLMNI